MRAKPIYDSKHWRHRAGQMRALALTMEGTSANILMNDLASDYDKIADENEPQVTKKKPK